MMVGVPVLFCACDSACVPLVWVMAVGVGVCGFWWCVFQWCVAVVPASRRVPGVLVWGVCVLVCLGVGWLVSCVRVVLACSWCACVVVGSGVKVLWWFRMLTCVRLSFFLVLFLLVCLVNNGLPWVWCVGLRVCGVFWLLVVCLLCACPLVVGLVCGAGRAVCPWWVIGLLSLCVLAWVRVFVFVCGVCVCLACVVDVVVWARGVLLPVVGCLCGLVMRLLGVA